MKYKMICAWMVICFFALTGCGKHASTEPLTMAQIIEHFQDKGFSGEVTEITATSPAVRIDGDNFSIEIYQISSDEEFSELENLGKAMGLSFQKNGALRMLIHEPETGAITKKLIDTFKQL